MKGARCETRREIGARESFLIAGLCPAVRGDCAGEAASVLDLIILRKLNFTRPAGPGEFVKELFVK